MLSQSQSFVLSFSFITAIMVVIYIVGRVWHLWETAKISIHLIRLLQLLSMIAFVLMGILFFAKALGLTIPFSITFGGIFLFDLAICWVIASRVNKALMRKETK